MTKKISILGSTGSVGKSTLRVADHLPDQVQVVALAAHANIDLLEEQAKKYRPEIVAVGDQEAAGRLAKRLPGYRVVGGMEGLCEAASWPSAQMTVSAITGTAALLPTLAALEAGKDVGLASKEVLVAAGALVMARAREMGAKLLPLDSEHSALFQCLQGSTTPKEVRRLIVTASGGPFRDLGGDDLERVSVRQALSHPTWRMGPKITVDSSTLMNKGLEVIEAYWLFGIPLEQIQVVVHPQSMVHSFVEFVDGSLLAQVGDPDMVVPIQYALTYPRRYPGLMKPFDFLANPVWEFYAPDTRRFVCLDLAFQALRQGGSYPCYLNAANEVLVQRFLGEEISWMDIGRKLDNLLQRHSGRHPSNLEEILAIDLEGRHDALSV